MMQKWLLLLLTISTLSCSDNRVPIFSMDMEVDFLISADENTIATNYDIVSNVKTFFSEYSVNTPEALDALGSINGTQCVLTGVFGGVNYEFIRDIAVSVVDPTDPTKRGEIFYLEFVEFNNPTELELFASLTDVKEIVSNELVAVEVKYNLRGSPPGNIDNRLSFTLTAFEKE